MLKWVTENTKTHLRDTSSEYPFSDFWDIYYGRNGDIGCYADLPSNTWVWAIWHRAKPIRYVETLESSAEESTVQASLIAFCLRKGVLHFPVRWEDYGYWSFGTKKNLIAGKYWGEILENQALKPSVLWHIYNIQDDVTQIASGRSDTVPCAQITVQNILSNLVAVTDPLSHFEELV